LLPPAGIRVQRGLSCPGRLSDARLSSEARRLARLETSLHAAERAAARRRLRLRPVRDMRTCSGLQQLRPKFVRAAYVASDA
jgi:hypothetical protein